MAKIRRGDFHRTSSPPPWRRYSPPLPMGSFQHLMRPMTDIFAPGGAGSRRRFEAPQDSMKSPIAPERTGGGSSREGAPRGRPALLRPWALAGTHWGLGRTSRRREGEGAAPNGAVMLPSALIHPKPPHAIRRHNHAQFLPHSSETEHDICPPHAPTSFWKLFLKPSCGGSMLWATIKYPPLEKARKGA